jgi:hypothetical protein
MVGGQILELEDVVGGDDAIAELPPGLGHERPRAGGDHDRLGADPLSGDLDQGRLDEAGIVLDEDVLRHVVGAAAQDAIHEGVAQILNVLQRLRDIQGHTLVPVDAVFAQMRPPMIVLGDLNHGLGRHAADPRTGGARLAPIDQTKVLPARRTRPMAFSPAVPEPMMATSTLRSSTSISR